MMMKLIRSNTVSPTTNHCFVAQVSTSHSPSGISCQICLFHTIPTYFSLFLSLHKYIVFFMNHDWPFRSIKVNTRSSASMLHSYTLKFDVLNKIRVFCLLFLQLEKCYHMKTKWDTQSPKKHHIQLASLKGHLFQYR